MLRLMAVALLACALALAGTAADARTRHHAGFSAAPASAGDPRPGRWCMWWLRRHLGIPKSAFPNGSYNVASAGRFIGAPAAGPAIGVIVVWWHHVGVITGRTATGWIVESGNDGGAVRARERPLRGAIAFRHWPGGYAAAEP